MENKETKQQRIVFDIDLQTHKLIKMRALLKNVSMKKYILQAVAEKIAREKPYD